MSKNENSLLAILKYCVAAYIEKSPLPVALFSGPFLLQIAIICVAVAPVGLNGIADFATNTTVVKAT